MKRPPFHHFPFLSDEKVLLRQIEPGEVKDIIDISFYDAKKASSVSEALQMLEKIYLDYANGESIHWGIVDKTTNIIVGTCGYYRGFNYECGELGCVLIPQYQGFGFMTHAMQLSVDFGFNTMELKKIIAITRAQNTKAIDLMQRLGFLEMEKTNDSTLQFQNINKYTSLR